MFSRHITTTKALTLTAVSIVFLFATAAVIEVVEAAESCPGVDMTALRTQREQVVRIWASRTNQDQEYLRSVYQNYATADVLPDGRPNPELHNFVIDEFGRFEGNFNAEEYAVLAADPQFFNLDTVVLEGSMVWVESNVLNYRTLSNYSINFIPAHYDGFVNYQQIVFATCSNKVWIDYSRQDPLVADAIVTAEQNLPPEQICELIMRACTGVHQVYDTFDKCVEYIGYIYENNPKVCPSQLSNNSNCYFFHAGSALYNPDVHCPHVRPWYNPEGPSVKCRDFCVEEGCGSCHPNAKCVFTTPFGDVNPTYACECKEGYTGDGINSCVLKTCTADWQCPSNTNYVECASGVCDCVATFKWNSTSSAATAGKSCGCGPEMNLLWTNNVPSCVPVGRCRPGHREDCTLPSGPHSWNSVQCREYGFNPLIPDHSCLCNYGFDNLGFMYPCKCSAPKRVVWSPSQNGDLCLATSECTESWHCSNGKTCRLASGNPIGACV